MAVYFYGSRNKNVERIRRNPLNTLTNDEIVGEFRLDKSSILELCQQLEPQLKRKTHRSNSLSVEEQVLIALKVLASGSFQNSAKDNINVAQPTVSVVLKDFIKALLVHVKSYIYMPRTDQLSDIKTKFFNIAGFSRVMGAIDGTHIPIIAPAQNEHLYVCRKGFHSINVQAMCDSDLVFMDIVAKWPGATHDSFILQQSNVYNIMETGLYGNSVLLGDSGYPLMPWLMTPFNTPSCEREERFNIVHKKTRVFNERAFGVLKQRFRILDHTGGRLCYTPRKASKITVACCILHNICRRKKIPLTAELLEPIAGDVVHLTNHDSLQSNQLARDIRQQIASLIS